MNIALKYSQIPGMEIISDGGICEHAKEDQRNPFSVKYAFGVIHNNSNYTHSLVGIFGDVVGMAINQRSNRPMVDFVEAARKEKAPTRNEFGQSFISMVTLANEGERHLVTHLMPGNIPDVHPLLVLGISDNLDNFSQAEFRRDTHGEYTRLRACYSPDVEFIITQNVPGLIGHLNVPPRNQVGSLLVERNDLSHFGYAHCPIISAWDSEYQINTVSALPKNSTEKPLKNVPKERIPWLRRFLVTSVVMSALTVGGFLVSGSSATPHRQNAVSPLPKEPTCTVKGTKGVGLNIRNQRSINAAILETVPEGAILKYWNIIDSDGHPFAEVQTQNGVQGYASMNYCK